MAPLNGTSDNANDAAVGGENTARGGLGVHGVCATGHGVRGESTSSKGVVGTSKTFQGVYGHSEGNAGVVGESDNLHGVFGIGHQPNCAGVFGTNDAPGGLAGLFDGDIAVSGDIRLTNAGCAEDFDISDTITDDVLIEPGTVMVLDLQGTLRPCSMPYDKCVVGVVSGARDHKPSIIFNRHHTYNDFDHASFANKRRPIAIAGKVFCKADASEHGIKLGDTLTTSSTSGHAMAAWDNRNAFGAVLGKALGKNLRERRGLIPILIALY